MQAKLLNIIGIFLTVLILAGGITSCKSSHQVCPAYTQAGEKIIKQF